MRLLANKSDANQIAWLKHKSTLDHVQNWQFSGRFGAKTDTEHWTGNIVWSQNADQYTINITGPLSTASVILEGDHDIALLHLSDETSFSADNAQSLLQSHTGLKLPVNELRYWLLGLPSPDNKSLNMELNKDGQLTKLLQNDWEVTVKRYTTADNLQLPDKIFLINHEINVRLIIQQWQILS